MEAANPQLPCCFQQRLGSEHIGPKKYRGVEDGPAVVGLSGEVHDYVRAVLFEHTRHEALICDVALREDVSGWLGPGDILDSDRVAGVCQRVDVDDNVVAILAQPIADEIGSDETCSAGD